MGYLVFLREISRREGLLGCCRAQCADCGIWFLTKSCNRGRKNVRCPFGCRESRSKKLSAERSLGYYASPEGKRKKRAHNRRRKRTSRAEGASYISAVTEAEVTAKPSQFPRGGLVRHAVFVVCLEDCGVSADAIRIVLRDAFAIWRQLSLTFCEVLGYSRSGEGGGKRWPP